MAATPREGHEPCEECSGEKAEGERKRPQNDPGVKRRGAPPKQIKDTASDRRTEGSSGLPVKSALVPSQEGRSDADLERREKTGESWPLENLRLAK